MFIGFICGGSIQLHAQPENSLNATLLEANRLFDEAMYEEAIAHYNMVLEQQPSNGFVLERIKKANEEIIYAEILEGIDVEKNALAYLSLYDNDGKYTTNVQKELSRKWLSQAYQYYHKQEIEKLENLYIEYLNVLGRVNAKEMKSWLYSLYYDEAVKKLKKKKWKDAKFLFEQSVKYANDSGDEFKNAQEGIMKASKKIK